MCVCKMSKIYDKFLSAVTTVVFDSYFYKSETKYVWID